MIVDASVLVAAHSDKEPFHALARDWYTGAIRSDLAAPSIVLAEVSAAIARAGGDAALASQVIANLTSSPLEIVPVDQGLALEAAAIARDHRVRGCDAVYVALAQRLGRALITLDEEQISRGSAVVEVSRPVAPAAEEPRES